MKTVVDDRKELSRIYHDEDSTKPIDVHLVRGPINHVAVKVPEISLRINELDAFIHSLNIAKEKALSLQG